MQEKQKLFQNIPYTQRTLKGSPLVPAHAEEAIKDVLADTSIFFQMPSISDILRVKSESVYGVHKIVVTLKHGTAHPEYMLNARVVELEPKLVNVLFETGDIIDPLEHEQALKMEAELQEPAPKPKEPQQTTAEAEALSHQNRVKDISLLTLTCSRLNLSYPEFAKLIGYESKDVIAALSRGDIEAPMKRAIELYLENLELKQQLEALTKI